MTRKERPHKNPYCKRSRFNKGQFEALVYSYFTEVLWKRYKKGGLRGQIFKSFYGNHLLRKAYFKKYPTRQAISRNFDKIGQYIWNNFIVDLHPSIQEEDFFDGLLDSIHNKKNKREFHKDFFEALYRSPLKISEKKLSSSMILELLSCRAKTIRGFKRDKFYLEFSRIFFICLSFEFAIEKGYFKFRSFYALDPEWRAPIGDMELLARLKAAKYIGENLLHFLIKKPM